MSEKPKDNLQQKVDTLQHRLTHYASELQYRNIPPEAIHAAKGRIICALGALIGGFSGEPCRIARKVAAAMPNPDGATVIGTQVKTTPDMAAFVNGSTARYAEVNDVYHWPGSQECHPTDVIMPILAAAEYAHASGSEFLCAVVLAYEVLLRIADVVDNKDFDNTNFCCLATAMAAGKLLGLSARQLAHCISMAVVPNNILRQVRRDRLSMWKAVAAGHAGRAGVFAAILARAGMDGPDLPFEGKAGWCTHVARKHFSLDTMGGGNTPFKILATRIKNRAACGPAIPCILAAEKIARLGSIADVAKITVEVYRLAKETIGVGNERWDPASREAADHSGPYVVAATLMDGTITPGSFDDGHLWNLELRALMQKIEVIENDEFTKAYERIPVEHRARVTVTMRTGERLVGETGGDEDDLSAETSDAQIADMFRGLAAQRVGTERIDGILETVWSLDALKDVSSIPPEIIVAQA